MELADSVMHFSTKDKLVACLDEEIIQKHHQELLRHLPSFLDSRTINECQKLLSLFFYSKESRKNLEKELKMYLVAVLEKCLDYESDKDKVKKIIELRHRMHAVVKIETFKAYRQLIKLVDDQFKNFITDKKLELNIVKYFHSFISKVKWSSGQEMKEFYCEVSDITSLVNEKTLFTIHYVKYLQKRLINYEDNRGLLYENKILDNLKFQGFQEFSRKAEIPIKDLRTSFSLNSQFDSFYYSDYYKRDLYTFEKIKNVTFTFKVLTSDFWNTGEEVNVKLPKVISRMQSAYETFFQSKFKERKLKWKTELGKASINFKLGEGMRRKELVMTKLQALICLLFNQNSRLTFQQLMGELGLKKPQTLQTELKGLLFSKVIVSSNAEKVKDELRSDSIFSVNTKFSNKRNLIKIKTFKYVEQDQKEEKTSEKAFIISKKIKINSCLMKIMKSSKKVRFDILMNKAILMLSEFFTPQRREILKGIEELINKEFLARDEEFPNILHYT